MSQLAQLSEAEIDDRYRVTGKTAIQFMLAGFAKARENFTVQFQPATDSFLTSLLEVDAAKGRLIVDCSGSSDINRAFAASTRNLFVGRPGGVPVRFLTGPAVPISYQGSPAFAVAIPDSVIRMQRREYFRVDTPRIRPLMFTGYYRTPDDEPVEMTLPVHDISVSGLGLNAEQMPEGIEFGTQLENCRVQLPEETRDLTFNATVRRVVEIESRSGIHYWRVGIQFNRIPAGDETRIQRYIAKIERERHELGGG